MDSENLSKKEVRLYKFTTFLLLDCMLGATLCGLIFIRNAGTLRASGGESNIPSLKKMGYPLWTSLPLTLSIVFGFYCFKFKSYKVLAVKILVDVINIILRVMMLVYTEIIITDLGMCITKDGLSERYHGSGDDMGYGVRCTMRTVSKSRLEYGILLMVFIYKCIAVITLFVNCIFYCIQLFCTKIISSRNNNQQVLCDLQEE